ncbi:MAG TPA: hypothetical protein VKD43_07870 [Xanthobacteraceae bacterium]|nr:hypothetical protein [Xanthobacteraceae bacterium]
MRGISVMALLLGITILPSGQSAAQQQHVLVNPLQCEGPLSRDTDHATLVTTFGADNVLLDQDYVTRDDGTLSVSTLFPNDNERELRIVWKDKRLQGISRIEIWGSAWSIGPGIRVGTTLLEVERLNGRPFRLAGFGWDGSGEAGVWERGKLARLLGGCHPVLYFDPGVETSFEDYQKVMGDDVHYSDSPAMRTVKPIVRSMTLAYELQ